MVKRVATVGIFLTATTHLLDDALLFIIAKHEN
jgi:hypothetical protein